MVVLTGNGSHIWYERIYGATSSRDDWTKEINKELLGYADADAVTTIQ
jgi:hypothetical protein